MRKRSRTVALVIVGAAAFGLTGCKEEQTDARAFPDVTSCKAAAAQGSLFFTEADCDTAFAEAQAAHLETAPRYESKELCEAEHGEGNCGGDPAASAGGGMGSIFLPLFAGYMLGSMLGGNRGVMSQPLSRTADGRFATPGGTTLATNNGAGKMGANAFAKAPATVGKPPMTKAQVAQRGGFGAAATGRSPGATAGG